MHSLLVVQPCCGRVKHTGICSSIRPLSVARPVAARWSQRVCRTFVECSVEVCRRRLRFPRRCGGVYGNRGVRGQLNQQQRVCLCLFVACVRLHLSAVCPLSAVRCPLSAVCRPACLACPACRACLWRVAVGVDGRKVEGKTKDWTERSCGAELKGSKD